QRHVDGDRPDGAARGGSPAANSRTSVGKGLVFGDLGGLAGHPRLCRRKWSALDERGLSARTCRGSVSTHGERQGALSRSPDDRELTILPVPRLDVGARTTVNVNFPLTKLPS